MKAVTAFLVVIALVAFATLPAFAVERGVVKAGDRSQTPVREVIDSGDPGRPQGEAVPVIHPTRATELLAPITPGTYTIGAAGTYTSLSAAVAALMTEGLDTTVTGSIIFEFIDAAYVDTGVTLGPVVGQSLSRPIIFRPASGVNARIFFTGGTAASYNFGVRLNNVLGVTWDGSNNGTSSRNLTIEGDTTVAAAQDKNMFIVQRSSENVVLKNMIVIGNRRAPSGVIDNSADVIRINNVVTPAATGPLLNITVQNCRIYRGNAGIALLGRDLVVDDANFFFIGNEIGGFGGPFLDNQSSNFFFLRDANNVVMDGNYCYGAVVNGTPIGVRIDRRINGLLATNNTFRDVSTVFGASARPMYMLIGNNPAAAPVVKVRATFINNFFFGMRNTGIGTSGRGYQGWFYNPTSPPATAFGGGSTVELIHNTFAWNPQPGELGTLGTLFMNDGNFFGGGTIADTMISKNNIYASKREDGGFTRTYLLFNEVTPGAFNLIANNNTFYQADAGAFGQYPVPYPGGTSTVFPALSDWQAASGNDVNSKQGDPVFVNWLTNPHISTAIGDVSAADSVGAPGLGVTVDIDGQPRDAARPDAGADEFAVTRFTNELAAFSIDFPNALSVLAAGGPFAPKATFQNKGSLTQAAAPVRFQIRDTAGAVVYDQTATIAVGGYDNVAQATFPVAVGGLAAGPYLTRIIAELPGDGKLTNDTLNGTFNVAVPITPASFPYFQDFEGLTDGWITYTGGGPNDWVLAKPKKSFIFKAWSGVKAWVTKDSLNYSDNQEAYVQAPILNLSTFPVDGVLKLSFYHAFQTEDDFDGGAIEISTDGGTVWSKVDPVLGTGANFNTAKSIGWYGEGTGDGNIAAPYFAPTSGAYATVDSSWIKSTTYIAGLGGTPDVRIRWRFSADGGVNDQGWAFDDVRLEAAVNANVTFRVNMSRKMADSTFRPDLGDVVTLPGSFNGWNTAADTLTDGDADSIYTKTLSLQPGVNYQYKFHKTLRAGLAWEDGIDNRQVVTLIDSILPARFFNGQGPFVAGTFNVNMKVKMLEETFQPQNGDVVVVRGNFNGWNQSVAATDGDNDSIYTVVVPVYSDGPAKYKFFKTLRAGLDWESGSDRVLDVPLNTPTTFPTVFFDNDAVVDVVGGLAITPATVSFGAVPVGFTATAPLQVINTTVSTINVSAAAVTDVTNFGVLPTTVSIGAGDTATVTPSFSPSAVGSFNAFLVLTHDGPGAPDSIALAGTGTEELKYLSIVPDTIIAKDPVKFKLLKPVKRVKPGKPIVPPNWANLLDETVAQGGFQPGATEGDLAGGMVVGISHMFEAAPTKWKVVKDSAAIRTWVRLTKWNFGKNVGKSFNALQKTLEDKTGKHTLLPVRGLDFTTDGKNKPILKQKTKIAPKYHNSPLFAELVAFKFNIAASQLGKTPAGYGDLIFDRNGSFLDELSLLEVAEVADTMMTYYYLYTPEQFDSLYSAVKDANRAFVGALDTLTFMQGDSTFPLGKLTLKGQVNLATVPFLKLPTTLTVTRLNATTSEVESEIDDFDGGDIDVDEELPVAAKLYQNYPNPFNPSTTIAFALREASTVTVRIFNVLGQEVGVLLNNEEMEEGLNGVQFDAAGLSSGVYFYRIEAQGLGDEGMRTVETRKMMLLK